jgi:hypothetical protein
MSIGPLIAACCQAPFLPSKAFTGMAVALAPTELVGVAETGRVRLTSDCQPRLWINVQPLDDLVHRQRRRDCADAIAGVLVLSEVAKRLMMMSGPGASTCPAECGRTRRQPIERGRHNHRPSGHRRPGEPGQELLRRGHAALAWPHSNEVPSTQMH